MTLELTAAQRAALAHVDGYARGRKADALATIASVRKMCDVSDSAFDAAVACVKSQARVALHFHPDRPDPRLVTVAEALLESGIYKSQFETLLSNGSVSAHPGGERDLWEKRLFGGAYNAGATSAERPKYGALNLMLHPDGPSPRFGSCYFLLKPAVTARCTFTFLDSHQDPPEKGTLAEFDDVLAALLAEVFHYDAALGEHGLTVPKLLTHLRTRLGAPIAGLASRPPARNLSHYIEAQVHGELRLDRDAEVLVADPSFQGTPTGLVLGKLCAKYGLALHWHRGFALALADVPTDFRGPTMPSLARRIVASGRLEAQAIGPAVMDLKRNPEAWSDRGGAAEVLQEMKLLWHVLVKFGCPRAALDAAEAPAAEISGIS